MTVRIEDDGRIKGDFRINKVRYIPTAAIALLDKICSVEDAEVLRGGIISVKRDLLPELTEEEYYLTDLIGFTVNDHQQKRIGLVEDVMNLPANDVLILNYQEKELMIPLVDEFILLIDFEEKIVTVNVIDGLLEL
ncbi:MAG: ribosome maturation factor RimM [Fidelibacterota bacterium]